MSDPGSDDPFEQFARESGTAYLKAQRRANEKRAATRAVKVVQSEKDAPMKLSAMDQATAESSRQFRNYLRFKRAELREMLEGPDGKQWREMVKVLRSLTLTGAGQLTGYIRQQHWLRDADLHTRQVALSLIAGAIIKLRLENGYAPFDDSLFDEPPTVFQIIRSELRVMT